MTKFIKWSYVGPRLVVIFALLCAAEVASGWLAKRSIRAAGEAALGARVDIAGSRASLVAGRLEITGLQLANPDEPMKNLAAADAVLLDLDSASLLHKRVVVSQGVVRGLRFGTPRVTSGELPDLEETDDGNPSSSLGWDREAAEKTRAWLDELGERFAGDLADQFQSPGVAERLINEWPGRFDELEAAAAELRADAESLADQVADARTNPLRNADFLQTVPTRVSVLKDRLAALHTQLEGLPSQAAADREAIAAARRHDEQLVRDTLAVDALDPEALTAYLLGEEMAGPLGELVTWLRWARRLAPTGDRPELDPERGAGVDVVFAGLLPKTDLLVERLEIAGSARIAGRPVELAGVATDIASHPNRLDKPVRLQLTTTGALAIDVDATVDRTGESPRDQLTATCDGLVLPTFKLGQGWLGIAVEPSPASVVVELTLDGDRLAGDVRLTKSELRARPVGEIAADSPVAPLRDALVARLRRLPELDARVTLAGTLDAPEWTLSSNLGPALSEAVTAALDQSINDAANQLLAQTDAQVADQLAQIEQRLAAASPELSAALSAPDAAIERVAGELLKGNPLKRVSLPSPFKGDLK